MENISENYKLTIMKELSIEEKARRYDEAIERARIWKDKSGMPKDKQGILDDIFPELRESEDERIRKEIINYFAKGKEYLSLCSVGKDNILAWLEKQGEQEQLYIRFGEIPTDEKSKIFQGEIEVGTENGVSVYPALKTSEGDIVLGLSLPITKTTLYTQQHLIEYDDRPCYLVRGDYVGKDTDGQPLINNVSIIEKIDTYRIKEKKQGEHKLAWSEEDEKMIDNIIDYMMPMPIFFKSTKGKSGKEYTKEFIKEATDWLKSLKDRVQPQSTWKPSDEQMVVLELASKYERVFTPKQIDILIDLKEQLKKLTK